MRKILIFIGLLLKHLPIYIYRIVGLLVEVLWFGKIPKQVAFDVSDPGRPRTMFALYTIPKGLFVFSGKERLQKNKNQGNNGAGYLTNPWVLELIF